MAVSKTKETGRAMNGDVGDGEGPGGIKADSQEVRSPNWRDSGIINDSGNNKGDLVWG